VLRFSTPAITEALQWALTQAGKPYDFSAICGIAFDRDWRGSRRWFCSELIAAALEVVGSPLLNLSANVFAHPAARPPPLDAPRSDLRHIHPLLIEWPA
jgi:hypothetical protein